MMNGFWRTISLICLVLLSGIAMGQDSGPFEQGKEAYKNGEFQQAVDLWAGILEDGKHSSELYFNLGNAYYKLNQIGPSIYYYEKALQLDPSDPDIQNNLAFAENARIDVIEPLPRTIFTIWYNRLSGILTYDGWAWGAVLFAFLTAILFLLYYFAATAKRKRLSFVGSLLSGLLMLVFTGLAFLTYSDFNKERPAIVFDERVEVRTEPTMRGEEAFVLHEGTKVQILSQDGDWVRIELADGKDGWLPLSAVEEL